MKIHVLLDRHDLKEIVDANQVILDATRDLIEVTRRNPNIRREVSGVITKLHTSAATIIVAAGRFRP